MIDYDCNKYPCSARRRLDGAQSRLRAGRRGPASSMGVGGPLGGRRSLVREEQPRAGGGGSRGRAGGGTGGGGGGGGGRGIGKGKERRIGEEIRWEVGCWAVGLL